MLANKINHHDGELNPNLYQNEDGPRFERDFAGNIKPIFIIPELTILDKAKSIKRYLPAIGKVATGLLLVSVLYELHFH